MSSSSENHHDWEFSKENAAPLQCGRSTKSLSKRAFGTSTAEMEEAEKKTKKYENLVRRSEMAVEWLQKQAKRFVERDNNNGGGAGDRELTDEEAQMLRDKLVMKLGIDPSTKDRDNVDYDPIRYWVLYIKHIRENYPSDSQKQFLLHERCARAFTARPFLVPKYQNDSRFIRICVLYADKTSNPSEVFKMMSKIKVGTKVALFWNAWAWFAEKSQDFQFTEKIFQKALAVGAEPRKALEDRQRQFLRRMSRHWLNASQAQEDELDEDAGNNGGRGALNSLSSAGVGRNDRGSTSSRHAQQQQNGSSQTSSRSSQQQPMVGFSIFQDGDGNSSDALDDENAPGGRQRLARESDRTKENNMRPEQWNERGYGLVNPAVATTASSAAPSMGADSIVGTVRDDAPAFGRPPIGGHQRTGSAAAFDVFVDDEFTTDEADAKGESKADGNNAADQRSLRQRLDGGAADRLTRDPLRYMKNPSKIESDQLKYDARPDDAVAPTERKEETANNSAKAQKPEHKESKESETGPIFDKQLLKADSSGHECCFEEQRMVARYYKLNLPDDNFNLLKEKDIDQNESSSQMDVEESMDVNESTIEEIDMEDDREEVAAKPAKSVLKSSLRHGSTAIKVSEEEVTTTVNPRRVLFGANTNVVYTNDAPANTSTASSELNGSFVRAEETINTKLANAEISMMFSSPNANASLSETPAGKSLLSSSFNQPLFSTNSKKNTIGSSFAIHDENKVESGGLNFSIYQEDANEKSTSDDKDCTTSNGSSFAIQDENKVGPGGLNFSIYQEDTTENADDSGLNKFLIHDDNKQDSAEKPATLKAPRANASGIAGEDTASLSVIGDVMDALGRTTTAAPLGFGIYSDPTPKQHSAKTSINPREKKNVEMAAEDTASLSIIGDVMGSLSVAEPPLSRSGFAIYSDENHAKPPRKEPAGFKIFADDSAPTNSPERAKPAGLGFEIFSDEVTGSAQKKQKVASSNEPCFGDISRIEDEKTGNFQLNEYAAATLSKPPIGDIIDYAPQHKKDMESAMRKCMATAAKSHSHFEIFDYRKKPMPKALLRKSFTSGTNIDLLGGETVTILNELGRGVYGVVLLCTDENGQSDALKIQAPIGSLAHEYSLLLRIEERVEPDASGFYPFPRARALHAFSEGGLFSMTAGSDSGMTLIDVVNTYTKIMGNVPELIAIYYTSRMLKHLESLHQEGKVLHADVKPDNWVLSRDIDNAGTNAVGGADLMLVDFGRSIDLEKVPSQANPLQAQIKGNIAAEDMECGSMRKGLPWGVDLDFFGLAASSFILLFGTHMEVVEDRRSGKWRIHKPLRRYWQRELWSCLFDSLLNFDSNTDNYCLRDIRIAFDEYIDGKQRKREIATHVNQLYTHLPKKR